MTGALLLLKEQVQRCAFSEAKSFQKLQRLIHQITNEIGKHYTYGNDSVALYDILHRFQQAEQHLHIFKPSSHDTSAGEYYIRGFNNAKNDTLYLLSLLQSAIRFGQVVPLASELEI